METKFEKGAAGEKYVTQEIANFGYKVLYVGGCQLYAITGEKFYCVDLYVFGLGRSFWVQVKTKEPRTRYPDTGMEMWRYKNLIRHQQESGLEVLVLFTDNSGKIYGEWLDSLPDCKSCYGCQWNFKTGQEMIYWELAKLKPLERLLNDLTQDGENKKC